MLMLEPPNWTPTDSDIRTARMVLHFAHQETVNSLSGVHGIAVVKECPGLANLIEMTLNNVITSMELTDDLSHKLERRKLAMLCLTEDSWHLVGAHTPAMSETLGLIIEKGTTTAKELAADLGLQMNACVNRVARLAKLHLIRREQIGMSGPQAIYSLHSILKS